MYSVHCTLYKSLANLRILKCLKNFKVFKEFKSLSQVISYFMSAHNRKMYNVCTIYTVLHVQCT